MEGSGTQRTELAELGEFGLIERIRDRVKLTHPTTLRGIGDDAAVVAPPPGEQLLVSTDLLCEGIHFDLGYTPLEHLGYKAVAVNVSDIAAMNGIPAQITVGLALSNRFSVQAVDALMAGMLAACRDYSVDLVGGDTTSSRSGLVISITALGFAKPEHVVTRAGAAPGQVVCVTGDLGSAYLGLQVLQREREVWKQNPEMQPEFEGKDYLLQRQLKPAARLDIVHELRDLGVVPTAMIDLSDGLASDLLHICRQSNVGAAIYEEQLPIDNQSALTATELHLVPATCALNGGEDYELLFTVTQQDFEKIRLHHDILPIGITRPAEDGTALITAQNQAIPLRAQGWVHF